MHCFKSHHVLVQFVGRPILLAHPTAECTLPDEDKNYGRQMRGSFGQKKCPGKPGHF